MRIPITVDLSVCLMLECDETERQVANGRTSREWWCVADSVRPLYCTAMSDLSCDDKQSSVYPWRYTHVSLCWAIVSGRIKKQNSSWDDTEIIATTKSYYS